MDFSRKYKQNFLERGISFTLAVTYVLLGFYYIGPWYVPFNDRTFSGNAPALDMFPNIFMLRLYGFALIVTGGGLLVTVFKKTSRWTVLGALLLVAFSLRLYQLIGLVAAYESVLPPSYLPSAALVVITGVMWIWVKANGRPPEQ